LTIYGSRGRKRNAKNTKEKASPLQRRENYIDLGINAIEHFSESSGSGKGIKEG
jgi:hypothetical protein